MFSKIRTFGNFNQLIRNSVYTGYAQYSSKTTQKSDEPIAKSVIRQKQDSNDLFGQPTYETHPHLLKAGEIIGGINLDEIVERRHRLVEIIKAFTSQVHKSEQNHVMVIPSSAKKYMSDKIPYTFRQSTDFLYLTGCMEPDSCLVISVFVDKPSQMIMFVRPRDLKAEMWEGSRTGVERAPKFFGVDASYPSYDLERFLHSSIKDTPNVNMWYDFKTCDNPDVVKMMETFIENNKSIKVEAPTAFVHKMRLIKSRSEIELMKESCRIASQAINTTMRDSLPGMSEQTLYACVDSECRKKGAQRLAYPPVIAGGVRANTIHYIYNNQIVEDGELVLMDAGCEYNSFSSDITRTWPIRGRFTPEQSLLYNAVLRVQTALIDGMMSKGIPTLDMLFDRMCLLLGTELQTLGILPKTASPTELARAAYKFCPHHVSHYLGMDVHDTPLIPRNIPIQPGMIFTVEPGCYIPQHNKDVPEMFRGYGIRIEDDILCTETGPVALTNECVRTIADIEVQMQTRDPFIAKVLAHASCSVRNFNEGFSRYNQVSIEGRADLMPGIKRAEFADRRLRLMDYVSSAKSESPDHNHLIIIPSSPEKQIEKDSLQVRFQPSKNIMYLSGCSEPASCLLLIQIDGKFRSVLLLRSPQDVLNNNFEGNRVSIDQAPVVYGVDDAFPFEHLRSYLSGLAKAGRNKCFVWFDVATCEYTEVASIMDDVRQQLNVETYQSPSIFIDKMRLIKSPGEVEIMRKCSKITANAVNRSMAYTNPGISERHLHLKLDEDCNLGGAQRLAYTPVVASGLRSIDFKNTSSFKSIQTGDLVIVDVGCEFQSYCCDISRTFPANGVFSPAQKILYEILCRTQEHLVNSLKRGHNTLDSLYNKMCSYMAKELVLVGFIKRISAKEMAKVLPSMCPHNVAHYIGMDVQDTPSVNRHVRLQPGMVLSIGPGIYIPHDRTDVADMFRGLAVRVEDDVALSETGPEILTADCIKSVSGIQKTVGSIRQIDVLMERANRIDPRNVHP